MIPALLPAEVSRLRHARCPRELSAVLAEVEPRLGREVTLADLTEVVAGHHGRTAPRKVATFVRDLPGWAGGAQLYQLVPGAETTTGRVVEYVSVVLRERFAMGVFRIVVSPATECGFVIAQEKLVAKPLDTTCPREALASMGYDVVLPRVEGAVA
jgi:hypothetical protein